MIGSKRMVGTVRRIAERLYERLLLSEVTAAPTHVAVIQDGNRRYARKTGKEKTDGHREGAQTTEAVLEWCDELGIEEVTLYAFSTENFERPPEEREELFDLISEKLREFADADRVHESEVAIRAVGDTSQLPPRVQEAIEYAEGRTAEYDSLSLNVALAYGGRRELLDATRDIAGDVARDELDPEDVDVETVEAALYDGPTKDVDLIIRTGGDERTSNFLPWQANGNEAAVYFCAPYWPEFRKIDFLRSIRTYQHRERAWRRSRARRALAVVKAVGPEASPNARKQLERLKQTLPGGEQSKVDAELGQSDHEPSD